MLPSSLPSMAPEQERETLEDPSLPNQGASDRLSADEARLIEQLRKGDVDAGHQFVRVYYPGVYRYVLYLTGRREAAEDLSQETFLQAWRRLDTFQGRAPLKLWLHRIAHREFLQALRSRRRHTSLEEVAELPAPPAADWAEAMELRDAIRKLPVEEGEVVILHYLEGYRCEEIARIVRAPVTTVKYRLLAARTHLHRELGEGDMAYVNAQGLPARQWSWLPLDQMYSLEARLAAITARGPSGESGGKGKPTVAAVSTSSGPPATDVVDGRLTRKVTLACKGTALSDLCEQLRALSGVHLAAGPSVADEKVTVFCRETPLREVMRQLGRPFGYTWLRSGGPASAGERGTRYRYELVQDLRSQLLEEELRNRDRNTAFLVLEREMERYRAYRDLSPDEALARSKNAPPEEKALLEKLAGYGWGAIQLYFRLTPQQQSALRAGEKLQFSQEPKPGELPLPSEIARGVLQSLRDVFFTRGADGFGLALGVKEPAPEHLRPTALPEARATASLSLRENEPGRLALIYDAGTFSHSDVLRNSGGAWRQGDGALAIGASPAIMKPDNRAANTHLAADPALRRRITVRTEGHCGAGGVPHKATSADALEALHRATGRPIVADFYTRLYPPASLTASDEPLFDALNRLTDAMHLRWNRDGEWLQFRSASFYDDRLKEVPSRLLSRWAASRRQHGMLTLDDISEIAGLTDAQLDGQDMAEGARECFGLAEWDLARSRVLRPDLRFLAELTPDQRQAAMSPAGLKFTKLSLPQQQRYIALAFRFNEVPLHSLEELEGAALRVEYTQPGGFQWVPRASNLYRWVVPLTPGVEGRRALMPPVAGLTPEEALAAAGRLDVHLREALLPEARRSEPGIQNAHGVAEAGDIVPTELNLWIVYVPGLSNRRNILVVDRQSNSDLSSW